MQVALLTTVKQRVVGPFVPLNDIARAARAVSRGHDASGDEAAIWRIPQGAAVDLPDAAARELLRLGYARQEDQE